MGIQEEIIKNKAFEQGIVYCPICGQEKHMFLEYLLEIFKDNLYAYLAAVLVTH